MQLGQAELSRHIRRRSPISWKSSSSEPPEGRLIRLPSRGDVDPRLIKDRVREQLIIEFCSR